MGLNHPIFAESFDHCSTRSRPKLLNFRTIGQDSGQRLCQRISRNLRRKKSGFFMRILCNDDAAGDPADPETIIAAFHTRPPVVSREGSEFGFRLPGSGLRDSGAGRWSTPARPERGARNPKTGTYWLLASSGPCRAFRFA